MSKLSAEQIAELKKKHGKVYLLTIGDKEIYYKEPGFSEVDAYYGKLDNQHISDSWRELHEVLCIGGDEPETVQEFTQVAAKLKDLIGGEAVATLKKL